MHNRTSSHLVATLRLLLGAFLWVVLCAASLADEDHDRARKALEAGEVLPLRIILERVERDYPGQVIDVELERKDLDGMPRWIYEIKLIRPGGALVKLKLHARDGSLLSEKTRQTPDRPGERR